MSINKYAPHVYVIPDDDADRQIADGFVLYHDVDSSRIQVMPVAGGWGNVLTIFTDEYIKTLRDYVTAHVVMVVDFDNRASERRAEFDASIPDDIKARVFVIGPKHTPEALKGELKRNFEAIGICLAEDCRNETTAFWGHDHLNHNDADRRRLIETVKPFLF